jgi:hypothetical protein
LKKIIYTLTILLTVLLFGGSSEAVNHSLVQFSIPRTDLQILIPEGWKKGGFSGENVLASLKAGKGLYPNLNITLEDHGSKTLKEIFQNSIKLLQAPIVHKQQIAEMNGMRVLFAQLEWDSMLGHLGAFKVLTKVGKKILVVTYVDKTSGMTKEAVQMYIKSINSLNKVNNKKN